MKQTQLYEIHIQSGAKMVEYAGFLMPLQYSGVIEENNVVRQKAGIFDVSHMGEIWIKGPNAPGFIQYVTTNDVSALQPGEAQYSCLPNGKGGIVDDIIVYCYSKDKYFFVVNASNVDKVWKWLNLNNKLNVELENSSEKISQLALQGPLSMEILQKLTDFDLKKLKSFGFVQTDVAGAKDIIISNTGYTGAGGYELYIYNDHVKTVWNKLIETGKKFGLKPCGLAARDILRLEMGYSLYGNEIDDTTSPIEAGLGWIVKTGKSMDFIDKEKYIFQKQNGTNKKLVAFEMIEKGIPRHGYEITDNENKNIGKVTSGTMSPYLNKAIGMGYVTTDKSAKGTIINIVIRDKSIKAKIVSLPFINKN